MKLILLQIFILMIRVVGFFIITFFFFSTSLYAQQSEAKRATSHQNFIQNQGQVYDMDGNPADKVLFHTTAPGMEVFITQSGITYLFTKVHKKKEYDEHGQVTKKEKKIEWNRVDMTLEHAKIEVRNIETALPSITQYHYYYAHAPEGIRDVQAFSQVTIKNIYPGIDWVLYASGKKYEEGRGGFKYDFIVHPGADASKIKMRYDGTTRLNVETDHLSFTTSLGSVHEGKLLCYQTINDKRHTIGASYILKEGRVEYQLSNVIKDETLIIDPPLVWATYVGGSSGFVGPTGMVRDAENNLYLSGYVTSTVFPTVDPGTGSYYQGVKTGVSNAFFTKFNEEGFMESSTYFGGGTKQIIDNRAMCIDPFGNFYLTGNVRKNGMPTVDPGGGAWFQNAMADTLGGDCYLLKFDKNGKLKWSTYYGGKLDDRAYAIVSDASGNIYVGGKTQSIDFPHLFKTGAYNDTTQNTPSGSPSSSEDAFILKFDKNGLRQWATFLGGSSTAEAIKTMVIDQNNHLIVSGISSSADFPLKNNGAYYEGTMGGVSDVFYTRFNEQDSMIHSTFIGGGEVAIDLTVDQQNNIYLSGITASPNFAAFKDPGSGAHYNTSFSTKNNDLFILKLDQNDQLIWGTLVGAVLALQDKSGELLIDDLSNLYFTGSTADPNFPVKDPGGGAYFDGTYNGATGFMQNSSDVILLSFDKNHALKWATFYGGKDIDWGNNLVMDTLGCLYVTGEWWSDSVYTINPGGGEFYQDQRSSSDEGFILKFCDKLHVKISTSEPICSGTSTGELSVEPLSGSPAYTYNWQPGNYSTATVNNIPAGTYTVTIKDASGDEVVRTVVVDQPPAFFLNASADTAIFFGDEAALYAIASGGVPDYAYRWSGGSTLPDTTVFPQSTTTYTIQVIDSVGCTLTKTITVEVRGEHGPFPNVFTPNGDGENDVMVAISPNFTITEGFIYNRWGSLMYTWEPTSIGWDGRLSSGAECPSGTYFYTVKAIDKAGGTYDLSGFITLLR